jgi:hypothetical protein
MRCMNRNKSDFWYATYNEKVEITDEYGNATGQFSIAYNEPVKAQANISAARGSSDVEMFGVSLNYDKAIVTDNMNLPISETSVLWIDADPATDKFNYVVSRVARSLNNISYAVRRVDVS